MSGLLSLRDNKEQVRAKSSMRPANSFKSPNLERPLHTLGVVSGVGLNLLLSGNAPGTEGFFRFNPVPAVCFGV